MELGRRTEQGIDCRFLRPASIVAYISPLSGLPRMLLHRDGPKLSHALPCSLLREKATTD